MRKRGRPRGILRNPWFEDNSKISLPAADDLDFAVAFGAACMLHTLECGSQYQKARCSKQIAQLKRSSQGLKIDPVGTMRGEMFLEQFIERYAPGWNWRKQVEDDASREKRKERDQRIAKEKASMARHDEAWRNRFVTTDEPDACMLYELRRRVIPTDSASWPTLRELKIATAISERELAKIIADLRPTKGEIVIVPRRRRFANGGAFPKRFAPRIVISVVKKFARQFRAVRAVDAETQKYISDLTTRVIRSLSAKVARYR